MATAAPPTKAVLLRSDDNVAVAAQPIPRGFALNLGSLTVEAREPIGLGHKVALCGIAQGEPVRKYGQIIGFASRPIPAGAHVHTHNLKADLFERDYAFATERPPVPVPDRQRTFQGFLRPDGRVGTRNYIAVISTVNCSASTSRYIADRFRDGRLAERFPQRRRRLRDHAQGRLRVAVRGPGPPDPRARAGRFRPPPQRGGLCHRRPGLRGELCAAPGRNAAPDARALVRQRSWPETAGRARSSPDAQHPGRRGHHPDGRSGGPGRRRALARGQRLATHRAAGLEDLPGDGMRRLRRQLGRHGQPRARGRGRPADRAGGHGRAGRDHRDLRRRAPAHSPGRHAARWARSSSTGSSGGNGTPGSSAPGSTTTRRRATRPAG